MNNKQKIFDTLVRQGENGCVKEPEKVIENTISYVLQNSNKILSECINCKKKCCTIR